MRLLFIFLMFLLVSNSFAQSFFLFTGTYTDAGSKGIYVYKFNALTGNITLVSNTDSVVNPSFLILSNDHNNLYAVNETGRNTPGTISAFAFDRKSRTLKFINKQETGGDDPCYLTITKNKKWIMVANYSGGSVSAFPVENNGSLKRFSQLIQDSGTSVNKDRQEGPHVHSAVFSPDEKFLFTPDLGIDKVMEYRFNSLNKYPLKPANPPYISSTPGSGPRHFIFSPDHHYAYLIQELSGTVAAYKFHNGHLKMIQTIITHPDNYRGMPGSADIHIDPDGKFLYASNRGEENTIAIFSVNKKTGQLTSKGFSSTGGKTPRNFIIDPSGNYLIVANQNSDNIVFFKRNKISGALTATGQEIKVSKPVCLQIIKE